MKTFNRKYQRMVNIKIVTECLFLFPVANVVIQVQCAYEVVCQITLLHGGRDLKVKSGCFNKILVVCLEGVCIYICVYQQTRVYTQPSISIYYTYSCIYVQEKWTGQDMIHKTEVDQGARSSPSVHSLW